MKFIRISIDVQKNCRKDDIEEIVRLTCKGGRDACEGWEVLYFHN